MATPRYGPSSDAVNAEPRCCSASEAWTWVAVVIDLALAGDVDAPRWLGPSVDHALSAERWGRATPLTGLT